MSYDILEYKARFRLIREKHNWRFERSYHSKKANGDAWKPDSYHPSIKQAFRYLLDRLVAEGYEPKGTQALLDRIVAAEERVMQFGSDLEQNLASICEPLEDVDE